MSSSGWWLLVGVLSGSTVPSARRHEATTTTHVPAVSSAPRSPAATVVDWKLLSQLNVETGAASPAVHAIDGKRVKIAAFIVPLEDDLQEADEFLLVPYFGACIHTPPPPPNQMIYVKMSGHKRLKIGWRDPVMFEGMLHIWQVDSPYGAVSYDMDGIASTPYEPAKR